uniref:histone deacetylase n=1 Tax=Hevea brasiliensis TaxID=3981 RepID=A0A2D0YAX4_HEVBR|nr:histone deacetylase [Hevea brasiliensis]
MTATTDRCRWSRTTGDVEALVKNGCEEVNEYQLPLTLSTSNKVVVAESLYAKSEGKMVLETNRLVNGDSEMSLHKQSHGVSRNGIIGRHESLGSNGTRASCSYDEISGDEDILTTPSRDMNGTMDVDTFPDVVVSRKTKQREMTSQDMYNNQDLFDDDDDDSDWEPLQKRVHIMKWFCTNCTMVNLNDVVHCDICGEHKESGILRHGFLASPFSQDAGVTEVQTQVKGRNKDTYVQYSSSNSCTAVGFDERMLLHSEVWKLLRFSLLVVHIEMKSHPHPERPDRLRAIAASLATAGIFPGRCYPIPAREITQQELQMVSGHIFFQVHSLEHVQAVELTSRIFSSYFTPDTYANEHSACAARLAAGLCADLASAIFSGPAKNGFALVRPPGHHAGIKQAMGFCLHNNAAIAALAAQVAGAKKVLIVDWDVHHGNGTQEIFEQNKSVLYISLHRHEGGKFYPGTGAVNEWDVEIDTALKISMNERDLHCVALPLYSMPPGCGPPFSLLCLFDRGNILSLLLLGVQLFVLDKPALVGPAFYMPKTTENFCKCGRMPGVEILLSKL